MDPGERDLLQLKSLLMPASDDTFVLSRASSFVNEVNNDGPELLVSDATISVWTELVLESSS